MKPCHLALLAAAFSCAEKVSIRAQWILAVAAVVAAMLKLKTAPPRPPQKLRPLPCFHCLALLLASVAVGAAATPTKQQVCGLPTTNHCINKCVCTDVESSSERQLSVFKIQEVKNRC